MPVMCPTDTNRQDDAPSRDWPAWHDPYKDESSPLSQRLKVVQECLRGILVDRSNQPTRVISVCAGQGDDLLGVLASMQRTSRIQARLVELDAANVRIARDRAASAQLENVSVVEGDASLVSAYLDMVPADIILMCGVFGNVPDRDVFHTIDMLPQLCTDGTRVIWTRSRREPDLTPRIRQHFTKRGFIEEEFVTPESHLWSVGVNAFRGQPQPLRPEGKMFTFNV